MRATATRWLGILASPWLFGCAGGDGREVGPRRDNAAETSAVAAETTADDALERARCGHLEGGPFVPKLVTEAAWTSEDLAFDGKGHIVLKKGDFLSAVPAFGPSRFVSRDDTIAGLSLGLRFLPNGDLAVAQPAVAAGLVAKILLVHPDGTTGELLDASQMPADLPPLVVPNGVYADFDGSVWVTEFATSHVFRIGPDRKITSIVTGDLATTANGIVFDRDRGLLFYTNTSTGTLRRVAIANGPPFTPEIVTTIAQAALDGLTLDSCGNAYAIGSQKLWRISLDSRGVSSRPPTLLATFEESVASAQFGRGSGFDARSLYVSSIVGKVYRVDVGIRGAPVPLPP